MSACELCGLELRNLVGDPIDRMACVKCGRNVCCGCISDWNEDEPTCEECESEAE